MILSGEGVAKRGWGFNLALDPEVARHYANCAVGYTGYVAEVVVPEIDFLLDLDAPITSCVSGGFDLNHILEDLHGRVSQVSFDDVLDEAEEHEDASMSYSRDRAEEMLYRLFAYSDDHEAAEELKEFSPGYDWSTVITKLGRTLVSIYPDQDTGQDLLETVYRAYNGDHDKANGFLYEHNIHGTIGDEPISKLDRESSEDHKPRSIVVFNAFDLNINNWDSFEKRPAPTSDSFSP